MSGWEWVLAIGIAYAVLLVTVLGLCQAAGRADEEMGLK